MNQAHDAKGNRKWSDKSLDTNYDPEMSSDSEKSDDSEYDPEVNTI